MTSPKSILVIGGNAAGPAAAAKAKRTAPDANVILFEASDYISTGTCELPYALSGIVKNPNDLLFYSPGSFEQEKRVKVFVNHFVEKIDRIKKTVSVRNQKTNELLEFDYNKLILTTGSKAKRIPQLYSKLENVFTLKNFNNLLSIQNYLNINAVKNILVIGSGYIGLEAAESFRKLNYEITIIEKENLPMPGVDEEIQYLIKDLLIKNGINFLGGIKQLKFGFEGDKVKFINIEGRHIEFDLILLATGFEPNNDLAISSKLKVGKYGGLTVNQKLQTSDPNIFAAGDNIEIINKITGQPDYFPLATYAHSFGHIAGENAAGGIATARPVVKNAAVKVFDKFLVSVGLNQNEAAEHKFNFKTVNAIAPNLVKVMPDSENVFGKIIFDKSNKQILGASFFGGEEVSGYGDLISSLIHNRIKGMELANINFNYTPPLSPFVNLLSILGRKIEKE
ncbi:MAG: FAD-dependent oxidoreductase [Bacteroidota bacterium]